ncbi:mCG13775, isoform CRA_f, partial [Mus musculus]
CQEAGQPRKKKMDSLLLKTCLEASPECWSAQRLQREQLRGSAVTRLPAQLQIEASQWTCFSSASETHPAWISP